MKCKEQFKLSAFLFSHTEKQCFGESKWPCVHSIAFLAYRLTVMVYFIVWIFISTSPSYMATYTYQNERWKWLIFMTDIAFVILNIHLVIAAAVAIALYIKNRAGEVSDTQSDGSSNRLPWYIKTHWAVYNLAANLALSVSINYWALYYDGGGTDPVDINTHAIQAIYVVFDIMFTAVPIRFQHFWLCLVSLFAYMLFTLIYWAAGGTGGFNSPYIYSILNWGEQPGKVAGMSVAFTFVVPPVMQLIMVSLAWLRDSIYNKCNCTRNHNRPRRNSAVQRDNAIEGVAAEGHENPALDLEMDPVKAV